MNMQEANKAIEEKLATQKQLAINQSFDYNILQKQDNLYRAKHFNFTIHNLTAWAHTAARKFVLYILRPRFTNYVFVSHNGGKFDMKFIWNVLVLEMRMNVDVLFKHLGFISMSIGHPLNILFLDSRLYFNSSLSAMCVRFNLPDMSKPFFPYGTLEKKKYHLENELYENILEDFENAFETGSQAVFKAAWLKQQIERGATFSFKEELKRYCDNDVNILMRAICCFVRHTFEYQRDLIKNFDEPSEWGEMKRKKRYAALQKDIKQKQAFHMPLDTNYYDDDDDIGDQSSSFKNFDDDDDGGATHSGDARIESKIDHNKLIFPFLQTNPTSGSLAYKTMKLFCVPRDTFYVSSDPYGKNLTKSSFIEREYFHVMKKLGPVAGNIYFAQDVQTQVRMGNQVLDGYSPSQKIGYVFNGCWEHGHRGCPVAAKGFFFTFLRYL